MKTLLNKLKPKSKRTLKVLQPLVERENPLPLALPASSKLTLVDKTNRLVLSEGRNYFMGFGFAKREGTELHVVNPLSPCKDYLNDVVWTEATGKDIRACGLSYSKKNIFTDNVGYLIFGIMPYFGGSKYDGQDKHTKLLEENYPTIQTILNFIEEKLKVEGRSVVEKLKDNRFLLKVPVFWCTMTYRISLYTLIVRNAMFYKKGDILEWLKTTTDFQPDSYMLKDAIAKLEKMIKSGAPVVDMNTIRCVHDAGIIGMRM